VEPLYHILKDAERQADITTLTAVDNKFTEDYLRERGVDCVRFVPERSLEGMLHWWMNRSGFRNRAYSMQARCTDPERSMVQWVIDRYLSWSALSEIYSRIIWLCNLFSEFQPDVAVIYPSESYLGKVATRIAGTRKIPSIMFYQSVIKPHPMYGSDLTDYIACYGKQCKDALEAVGIPSEKLVLVGNPKYDQIVKRNVEEDRRIVGLPDDVNILLVAAHLLVAGTRESIAALARQLRMQQDQFKLVIRPHPDDDPMEYERILQKEGYSGALIRKDVPLYSLLNLASVVFTDSSTAGSEAVLFGKPLICINLTSHPYAVRYDLEGVASLVEKEEDIIPAIESALRTDLKHDKRSKFIERFAYRIDGRSSERFVHLIRSAGSRNPQQAPHLR